MKETKEFDLHIHSLYSDGSLTPKEIIREASKKGLKIISITDHDSLDAYKERSKNSQKIFKEAKAKGIELLPGIEFSVEFKENELHLLGYCFNPASKSIHKLLKKQRKLAVKGVNEITKKLQEAGFKINRKKIKAFPTGRLNLVEDILSNPLNKKLLNKLSLDSENPIDDFIYRIIPKNFCFQFPLVGAKKAIKAIKSSGGITVLAHPTESFPVGLWHNRKEKIEKVIRELTEFGLDGIETGYSKYSKKEQRFLDELAKKHKLLRTGGSDFHGKLTPKIKLGKTKGVVKMSDIKKLKKYCKAKSL